MVNFFKPRFCFELQVQLNQLYTLQFFIHNYFIMLLPLLLIRRLFFVSKLPLIARNKYFIFFFFIDQLHQNKHYEVIHTWINQKFTGCGHCGYVCRLVQMIMWRVYLCVRVFIDSTSCNHFFTGIKGSSMTTFSFLRTQGF